MNEMLFDVIRTINLLFGRSCVPFLTRFLTIAVVGLQHSIIEWDSKLETVDITSTISGSAQFYWLPRLIGKKQKQREMQS